MAVDTIMNASQLELSSHLLSVLSSVLATITTSFISSRSPKSSHTKPAGKQDNEQISDHSYLKENVAKSDLLGADVKHRDLSEASDNLPDYSSNMSSEKSLQGSATKMDLTWSLQCAGVNVFFVPEVKGQLRVLT